MAASCSPLNFVLVTIAARSGSARGWRSGSACCPRPSGGPASRFIPFLGLRNRPPAHVVAESGGLVQQSFGQLWATLKSLRQYPVALTFLLAYLFFNDGIQTVIASASIYGVEELGFGTGTVLTRRILRRAVRGRLRGARLRSRGRAFGAKSVILAGLVIWMVIVTAALFVPEGRSSPFLAAGASRSGSCWVAPRRCRGPTSAC